MPLVTLSSYVYVPSSLISSTAGPAIADGAQMPTPKLEKPTTAVGALLHINAPAHIALATTEGGNISSSSNISSVLGTYWDVEGPIADVKPEGVFMAPSVASASPTSKPSTQDDGNDADRSGKGEPSLPAAVGKETDDEQAHGKAAGTFVAPVESPGTAAITGPGVWPPSLWATTGRRH